MGRPLALGIDVGTQGARVIAAETDGFVAASASASYQHAEVPGLIQGWFEQRPEAWWRAVTACLREVALQLSRTGRSTADFRAIAVDSTSGTVVLADSCGRALRPAVMYNDNRANAEDVEAANAAAGDFLDKVGFRFNASFALPRLIWLRTHEPKAWHRTRKILHAADYIVARLTGEVGVTDPCCALKTGFDIVDWRWPTFLTEKLGFSEALFPRVVESGQPLGDVNAEAAEETGLTEGTIVVGGMTDGCADQIASGARSVGDWNTVIGSTLVLKGLTRYKLRDPLGRVYSHRHPMGLWMPGGASNTGCRVLDRCFPDAVRAGLDRLALTLSPTGAACYPLDCCGERFPLNLPEMTGFTEGPTMTTETLYAAHLEGIACIERLAYDTITELGAKVGHRIYTTGGGSHSEYWMQIRADILGKELARAVRPGAAMGSAIIAASRTLFPNVEQAAHVMTRIDILVEPRRTHRDAYAHLYDGFQTALRKRGIL